MADIRSSGVFADKTSGGGLFRGTYLASSKTKIPGLPINYVSSREWQVDFEDWGGVAVVATYDDLDPWTVTNIGTVTSEPLLMQDGGHSLLNIAGDAVNEGHAVQLANERVFPLDGRVIVFEARIGATDWTDIDFFVGLSEFDANIIAITGVLATDRANCAGFHNLASGADGLIDATFTGGSGTDVVLGNVVEEAFTDSTVSAGGTVNFHNVGIRIEDTDKIEFYVDGQLRQTALMSVDGEAFDDAMSPILAAVSGAGGATDFLYIDYVMTAQTRDFSLT